MTEQSEQFDIKARVVEVLQARRFAVLATEREGQPHSSLVAVTPLGFFRQLIFATYRNTRKYRNLTSNSKVSVFIDGRARDQSGSGSQDGFVLTALGHAREIGSGEKDAVKSAHLERHPDLNGFLAAPDCALVLVTVEAYQVVGAIDDVNWWRVGAAISG